MSATRAALIVRLGGEVDSACADAVSEQLIRAVAELPPPEAVVLDLMGVSFFCAAGIHALVRFADSCAERGVRLRLVADPESTVSRVVAIAGLDKLVPTFSKLDEAL